MALFSWIIRCIIVVALRTNSADSTASSNDTGVNGNGCSCKHNGKLFNIEPLQEIDEPPRFTAETYTGYTYYYNPCTPFKKGPLINSSEGRGCQEDVAICYFVPDHPDSYSTIGTQSSFKCGKDKHGNPQLEYKSRYGSGLKSIVQLNCDRSKKKKEDATFKVIDDKNWVFQLSHKCACGDGCPPTDPDGIVIPVVSVAGGVTLLILVAFVFYRRHKGRREAEERARLLDPPNNRLDQPNDIGAQRNDLPNLQNNGGRNSANISPRLPISSSCSDITEPAKDKYSNNRATGKSV